MSPFYFTYATIFVQPIGSTLVIITYPFPSALVRKSKVHIVGVATVLEAILTYFPISVPCNTHHHHPANPFATVASKSVKPGLVSKKVKPTTKFVKSGVKSTKEELNSKSRLNQIKALKKSGSPKDATDLLLRYL